MLAANATSLLCMTLWYKLSAIEEVEMVCFTIRFCWCSIAWFLIWHMSQTLESAHCTLYITHIYHSNVEFVDNKKQSHPIIMFVFFKQKTIIKIRPLLTPFYLVERSPTEAPQNCSQTPWIKSKHKPTPEDPPCCAEYSRMPELVWRLTIPMTMLVYSSNSNW